MTADANAPNPSSKDLLSEELQNFQQIALALKPSPGSIPSLKGVDIHGVSLPLRDPIGGDHLIYLDFNKRYDLRRRIAEAQAGGRDEVAERLHGCRRRAGILLADVSGHRVTDALIAAMRQSPTTTSASWSSRRRSLARRSKARLVLTIKIV